MSDKPYDQDAPDPTPEPDTEPVEPWAGDDDDSEGGQE
jgi:hypothetical protein